MIFSYKLKKDDKEILLEQRFAYDAMLEKFGIKKEESDAKCPDKIIQALENCFASNKVFFDIGKRPDYSIEFRDQDDKTIFKSYLEPTVKTFQAIEKATICLVSSSSAAKLGISPRAAKCFQTI